LCFFREVDAISGDRPHSVGLEAPELRHPALVAGVCRVCSTGEHSPPDYHPHTETGLVGDSPEGGYFEKPVNVYLVMAVSK